VISEGGERRALGGVPREQKMLKGHLQSHISPSILVYEDSFWFVVYGGGVVFRVDRLGFRNAGLGFGDTGLGFGV